MLCQRTNLVSMSSPYIIADQTVVRELNLSSVLRHLHDQTTLSRAQIAVSTGLNKSTVSSLVEELLQRGLIHETGLNTGNTGRPATLLEINPRAGGIVGFELGTDFVSVVLTDFIGNIFWKKTEATAPSESEKLTITQSLRLVDEAVEDCRLKGWRVLGVGLAIPGLVDVNEGLLVYAPNLKWRNIPLRKTFAEHTGLSVLIDNEANAAAIGEHLFGVAQQTKDFVFVYGGIYIGGGLFLNNKLYRGKNGFAGEFGHDPFISGSFDGKEHQDGPGSWVTNASQNSIIRYVQASLQTKPSQIISRLMEEQHAPLSISMIKEAADAGDKLALDAFINTAEALGVGIANLVNTFNPEKVILGGPLSTVGNYLLPAIEEKVEKYAFPEIRQHVTIHTSKFGKDASVIGAIALVVNDILSNPTHVQKEAISVKN